MISTYVSVVRNVNQALAVLKELTREEYLWRKVSPRGMETLEFRGTFITEYERPLERVLFSPARDANPFFHFMEALWILGGRRDVKFLHQYNSQMAQFSDDGKIFHAAYGHRLRQHFDRDQIWQVIYLLRKDPETRRAVMCIWDPDEDLNIQSKDIPCNDMVFFKLREGVLDMTVANRSNDAVLGAYGANAVQFAFLQEFIAAAVNAQVGVYRQVSDSFHLYTSQPAWLAIRDDVSDKLDLYDGGGAAPYPIFGPGNMSSIKTDMALEWLTQNNFFLEGQALPSNTMPLPFFEKVAKPIRKAWSIYKQPSGSKNERIDRAINELSHCMAHDWRFACHAWLARRMENLNEL